MISSLSKRIVFCGNYHLFTKKWNCINDSSNDNMEWDEFIGADNFKLNYNSKYSTKAATNRMKLNRVIDSSEYVIRCSFGKSSNPSSLTPIANRSTKGAKSLYGDKTDILVLRELNYTGHSNCYEIDASIFQPVREYAISDDLSVSHGIKTILSDRYNHHYKESDSEHNERYYREIGDSYSSTMVASRSDRIKQKETWLCSAGMYTEIDRNLFTHTISKKSFAKRLPIINKIKQVVESRYGINVKHLNPEEYFKYYDELIACHISYKELKKMIAHKKWASRIFTTNKSYEKFKWLKEEHEWAEWMETAINNGFMYSGIEAIVTMLNDSRFNDYEKYIIGVGGINEMFHVTPTFTWSAWEERLLLDKYIKTEQLKWLPEHVDELHSKYQHTISKTGMNLCQIN
jgi:hypothetical protein